MVWTLSSSTHVWSLLKLDRWRKRKTQTVVALDYGFNVFSKVSMLEIQTSEKRVESLWAHQGLIRINGKIVTSLPGEQFLNRGESVPPPSLPTYSHEAPHRLPLEGTAIRPSLDAGPSTCTSQTPEQLEIGFFINFLSLLYFVMPIWKELKEAGMSFLELDESAGGRVFLYFFEVRWSYNPLPRRHLLVNSNPIGERVYFSDFMPTSASKWYFSKQYFRWITL